VKPTGPHSGARYHRTARLFKELGSISAVCAATGLDADAVGRDLWRARKRGSLEPTPAQDAERWATETARISGLTVGTRGDLLAALGIDLVRVIAAECPEGVPLLAYIAAIVKDSYDTV
jgi:hypothetical protein